MSVDRSLFAVDNDWRLTRLRNDRDDHDDHDEDNGDVANVAAVVIVASVVTVAVAALTIEAAKRIRWELTWPVQRSYCGLPPLICRPSRTSSA